MRSNFEELVARRLTVKTDRNFDSRFSSYDFFYKSNQKETAVRSTFSTRACTPVCLSLSAVGMCGPHVLIRS